MMSEVFDERALMERIDGDLGFLEEIVSMLDVDGPDLFRQIKEAAVQADADAVVGPAHTLKGMLANFCSASAETAAREVEMMGREHRMVNIESAVITLQKETEQLTVALHRFLEDAGR
jgi:HPt (histidine-containing phosphotransfer) domain-containing protein